MTNRIVAVTIALLAVTLSLVGSSRAEVIEVERVLTYREAVEQVRASGGAVHRCRRVAPRHFHCRATWWYEQHEAEVEPDGTLVNETVTYIPEEGVCEVGLKGISVTFQTPPAVAPSTS